MPGNTLTKKSVLSVEEDGGYHFNLVNTAGGQDTTVTQQFTPDEMTHFISEGANIVLQRLAVVLGMKSRMSFRALGVNNSVVPVTYALRIILVSKTCLILYRGIAEPAVNFFGGSRDPLEHPGSGIAFRSISSFFSNKSTSYDWPKHIFMPGNTLTKKSVLSVEEDGGYHFNLVNTAGGQDTTVTQQFTPDEMTHFISEGANIVLQRLAVVLGMKSRMSFRALGVNNSVVPVTYAMLESRSISVQNVTLDCVGVERTLEDEEPTTWQLYFLNDGHMYTRSQIDSPVYMKIKSLPETFLKDEEADWVFPDFGKGRLNWEDDLEMYSLFLDRKEELKEDHVSYMRRHPELKAILGDFLQTFYYELLRTREPRQRPKNSSHTLLTLLNTSHPSLYPNPVDTLAKNCSCVDSSRWQNTTKHHRNTQQSNNNMHVQYSPLPTHHNNPLIRTGKWANCLANCCTLVLQARILHHHHHHHATHLYFII
eukprot:sb/3464262/